MNWRRIVVHHLRGDEVRAHCRIRDIRGCTVDLRSCPEPNIVIDVDDCVTESQDVADAVCGGKKCDLVVLYGELSSPGVLFVEVKNTKFNRQIDRGIEQIVSSRVAFDRLRLSSELGFTVPTYHGVLISNHTRRSRALRIRLAKTFRDHSIILALARCGEDVWKNMWGANS